MLAYHNDAKIKAKYVRRIEAHRKADQLVQGVGWESNGVTRGCAIGCTFENYDHSRGPVEIGVPEVLMRLEDSIFERLPKKDALAWPTKFLKAIPVGADLSLVHHEFCAWLLKDSGLLTITDENRAAIDTVARLHRRAAAGEKVASNEWSAAESAAAAARSAARSADSAAWSADSAAWSADSAAWSADWEARSSARSAAESAAESAARSADWEARSSAESAAESAGSAARSDWEARSAGSAGSAAFVKAWKAMADKLLEILSTNPLAEKGRT